MTAFGTLDAPDFPHTQYTLRRTKGVLALFLCQGCIDPQVKEAHETKADVAVNAARFFVCENSVVGSNQKARKNRRAR